MNYPIRLRVASVALTLMLLLVFVALTIPSAHAKTFTVLYNFTGSTDGAYPYASVVRDKAGNLYGTTIYGGDLTCSSYGTGCGTVFKIDTNGTETVLHSFAAGTTDGAYPFAGVVHDTVGNLYGTTTYGGLSNLGTVFKVDTDGTESVLYSFTGGRTDGCYPYGGVLLDNSGNLYGTTNKCGTYRAGTVYKIDSSGTETVLHNFAAGTKDGAYPFYTGLLMDKTGNLYGLTWEGGASGEGVVYVLSSGGTLTVLHSFTGGTTDGCYPVGAPAMDKQGNLYGTANSCGSSGLGIVWKVGNKRTETVLHNFSGYPTDGGYPYAGVILDAKGNLYGDTEGGGTSGRGTVYTLNKSGLTLLHSIVGENGAYPCGGVSRDAEGNFYGTASEGGSGYAGTVWKMTP